MTQGPTSPANQKQRLLHVSVGISDDALKQIGLVMALAALLDYQRMTLLERVNGTPIRESAGWRRKDLTKELKKAFANAPLDRIESEVTAWLDEGVTLLAQRDAYAHSITYYQAGADGSAGAHRHHPKSGQTAPLVDTPVLNSTVDQLARATNTGSRLEFEVMPLLGQRYTVIPLNSG